MLESKAGQVELRQVMYRTGSWFSYVDDDGQTKWDSAMSANYWVRFPTFDLEVTQTAIATRSNFPLDLFRLEVRSVSEVTAINVRWRYTNVVSDARYQRRFTVTFLEGHKEWSLGAGADVASIRRSPSISFTL